MTHATVINNVGMNGAQRILEGTVTISSYTTNGEDLSDIVAQFAQFDDIVFTVAGSTGYMLIWLPTSNKLKVMTATSTQASSSAYLGAIRFRAYGK